MNMPICKTCAVIMKCSKNDFVVRDIETPSFPSSYWRGDVYRCPKCANEVIIGFGQPMTSVQAKHGGIKAELTFTYE